MQALQYFSSSDTVPQLKEKAIYSGSLMIITRFISTFIQFISTIILARLLSPNDFGLVAMVTVFSLLLFNVGFNGFTEAIIQAKQINHNQVSTLFWIGLAISFALAIIFAVSSPLLAIFYKEKRVISISLVMSIGFIFSALQTEHIALIMRKLEFHKIMVNQLSSGLISSILAIAMALRGYGYWAIVARQLSAAILTTIIAWVQCPWRPGPPKKKSGTLQMLKFAANVFGTFAMNYFARNADKMIVGRHCGSIPLGNYDRAYRLFVLPVSQLIDPLSSVALSTLSKLRDKPAKFREYYLKAITILGLVGLILSSILSVAGREIIQLLLGRKWTEAGIIFTAFGPSVSIILLYQTINWLFMSQGLSGLLFKWTISTSIFSILSFLIGVRFGPIGVALAYGISLYILIIPGFYLASIHTNIKVKDILQTLWKYFISALISVLVALMATYLIQQRFSKLGILFVLIMKIFFVTSTYYLSLLILYRSNKPFYYLVDIYKTVRKANQESK